MVDLKGACARIWSLKRFMNSAKHQGDFSNLLQSYLPLAREPDWFLSFYLILFWPFFLFFATFTKTDRQEEKKVSTLQPSESRGRGQTAGIIVLRLFCTCFTKAVWPQEQSLRNGSERRPLCSVMRRITVHAVQSAVPARPRLICLPVSLRFPGASHFQCLILQMRYIWKSPGTHQSAAGHKMNNFHFSVHFSAIESISATQCFVNRAFYHLHASVYLPP